MVIDVDGMVPVGGAYSVAPDQVTREWVKKQEKCELHLHLGGSWPLQFLRNHAQGDALHLL